METTQPAAATAASASAAQVGERAGLPPRFSIQYLANGSAAFGTVLAVVNGIILSYFFGPIPGVLWTIAAAGLLYCVVTLAVRANLGERALASAFNWAHFLLVSLWMASAVAIWMTGDKGAWVTAVMIPASWAIHIIFSGKGNLKVVLRALAVCTVPMMAFIIYSAWSEFPMWVAIPCSISAVTMVASIAESAQNSNRNFVDLQKALAQAGATQKRLEFAIQSAGDGYFEIDLDTMMYTPNPALALSLGLAPGATNIEALRDRIHPEDTAFVSEAWLQRAPGSATGGSRSCALASLEAVGAGCRCAPRSLPKTPSTAAS